MRLPSERWKFWRIAVLTLRKGTRRANSHAPRVETGVLSRGENDYYCAQS